MKGYYFCLLYANELRFKLSKEKLKNNVPKQDISPLGFLKQSS